MKNEQVVEVSILASLSLERLRFLQGLKVIVLGAWGFGVRDLWFKALNLNPKRETLHPKPKTPKP